jgi:hypothetical protein
LTSLHIGENHIPEKEIREIMAIAMGMDSMKILCEVPFKDKTPTELDISGKNLGMEGILVVAEYLDGNRALTSLNVAKTNIGERVYNRGAEKWESPGSACTHPSFTLVLTTFLQALSLLPMPSGIWGP